MLVLVFNIGGRHWITIDALIVNDYSVAVEAVIVILEIDDNEIVWQDFERIIVENSDLVPEVIAVKEDNPIVIEGRTEMLLVV